MEDRILVEVDRKFVVMKVGLFLMDWSNVGVDKLVVEDRHVVDGGVGKGVVEPGTR